MGRFTDTGMFFKHAERDGQERITGYKNLILKEGKGGVYVVDGDKFSRPVTYRFDPSEVNVYCNPDNTKPGTELAGVVALGYAVAGPIGGALGGAASLGGRDKWYIEIIEKDGKKSTIPAKDEIVAKRMEKRIRKHI